MRHHLVLPVLCALAAVSAGAAEPPGQLVLSGTVTDRRIWPLGTVFLDREVMVLAWCCLRHDFRRFKVHQMDRVSLTDESFRPRRVPLLRAFLDQLRSEGRRVPRA